MKTAVIYARYSSYNQNEQSIEGQLRVCKDYAKSNKITIIKEYIDRAKTGTNANRPEFLHMIEDAKKKQFDTILVYKIDRFSRNKYDSVYYKHKLSQYNIKVISATEMITDTPEGKLMESILESFAEMYSDELSQKLKRGMTDSALKGQYLGGGIPLGYKVVDKKLVIDKDKAEIVKYIFDEYAHGVPKKQIITQLNKKGYTTQSNKPFKINSLDTILKNIRYLGIYESKFVTNENYCEPIIDKKTFEIVQDKLKLNKQYSARRKAKELFILTGKAFCGKCGNNLVGISGTSRNQTRHSYYTCNQRYGKNKCDLSYKKKEILENFVLDSLHKLIFEFEDFELLCEKIGEYYKADNLEEINKYFNTKLYSIEKKFDNIANKIITNDDENILNRLKEQAKSLTKEKEELLNQKQLMILNRTNITKEDIKNKFESYYFDNNNYEQQRILIENLINSIYVFDDFVNIYFNFDNASPITLEEAKKDIEDILNEEISNNLCSNIKGQPQPI